MHVPAQITANSFCFLSLLTIRMAQFPCHWTKDTDGSYHLHRHLMLSLFLSPLCRCWCHHPFFATQVHDLHDILMPSSALLPALLFAWFVALGAIPQLLQLPSHWKRRLLSLFLSADKAVVRAFLSSCCAPWCLLMSHACRSLCHVTMGPPWASVHHRVHASSEWASLGIRSCLVLTVQGHFLLFIPAPLVPGKICVSFTTTLGVFAP